MNSTMRVVLGIGVVVVAVVLLVVLKDSGGEESDEHDTAPPRRAGRPAAKPKLPTIVIARTASRSAGSPKSRSTRANRSASRCESDVADEVHIHGYDIMKDVKAGGSVTFDFPATIEGDLRGRARGPQGADPRAAGQPVGRVNLLRSCRSPTRWSRGRTCRSRPGCSPGGRRSSSSSPSSRSRPPGASRASRANAGAPSPRALSRVLLGLPGADRSAARSASSCSASPSTPGCEGTEAPDRNFALTFIFVTCWLGFPVLSVLFGNVFRPFNPWRAIGRAVGGGLRGDRRPALRPTSRYPERARALAGGARAGRLRLAGDRLRRQRRRRGRRLDPHATARRRRSSTAPTRWR